MLCLFVTSNLTAWIRVTSTEQTHTVTEHARDITRRNKRTLRRTPRMHALHGRSVN